MTRGRMFIVAMVVTGCALLAAPVYSGTQDFKLVNQTGSEVYSLYISESNNESWEEDVLGLDVLPEGASIVIGFSGRSACLWDMMVTDEEDDSLTFEGINLCQASVVVLVCSPDECWAEFE